MYVAMTRARGHLVIAVRPECAEKEGRVYKSPASRFVAELEGAQ
jgi:ATP-dependent exoDNAse (exonuclease V) beta subunit